MILSMVVLNSFSVIPVTIMSFIVPHLVIISRGAYKGLQMCTFMTFKNMHTCMHTRMHMHTHAHAK